MQGNAAYKEPIIMSTGGLWLSKRAESQYFVTDPLRLFPGMTSKKDIQGFQKERIKQRPYMTA